MNHRTTVLTRLAAKTPGVWVLLAAVWLNMAVLPCAMAFETAEHDCPHCPPAEEHAGHHGHGKAEALDKTEASCDESPCCDAGEATIETRSGKIKPSADTVVAGTSAIVELPARGVRHAAAADPPDPPGAFPPRHVLFCVYLD